jgi:hypothetical protein
MVTELTEQLPHNEGFIVSEANGAQSREEVTLLTSATVYEAGTVLGVRDNGKYERFDPDSSEGNDIAVAILCSRVDATEGDATGVVIERMAEVRDADLIWLDSVDAGEKTVAIASLLTKNIKVRNVATTVSTQST